MNHKLVIFPGAGDPSSSAYMPVYELLEQEARIRGYRTITLLKYPGHVSHKAGTLTLDSAVRQSVDACSALGSKLVFLGRSFGCFVALEVAKHLYRSLGRVILWGPPPFWLVWEMMARDYEEISKIGLSKHVCFDKGVFVTMKPIESLLRQTGVPVQVSTGSLDSLASPDFIDYLKSICSVNPLIQFSPIVKGAKHEVTRLDESKVVKAYLATVLG